MAIFAKVFGNELVFEADFVGEFEAFGDVRIAGLEFHHACKKGAVGGVTFVDFAEGAMKMEDYFGRSVMEKGAGELADFASTGSM